MSWLTDLLSGGKNPADAAMPYISKIPGETSPYLDPYFQSGKGMLDPLNKQYMELMKDPAAVLNKMGQSYQQSPGYQNAIKQAMTAGSHAAAAGGMAGTPQHEYQSMEMATNLADQDYNNWLTNAMNLYGKGLSGGQSMTGMGMEAGKSMADIIAQTLAAQGGYSYAGQAAKNQNQQSLWNNIFSGIGAFPNIVKGYQGLF